MKKVSFSFLKLSGEDEGIGYKKQHGFIVWVFNLTASAIKPARAFLQFFTMRAEVLTKL
jgi:hypothetical protein